MSDDNFREPLPKRKCTIPNTEPTVPTTTSRWSTTEKQDLYNAILKFGSSNLDILHKVIPTKKIADIKYYLGAIKRCAKLSLKEEKDPTRVAPIDKWLNFMQQKEKDHKAYLSDFSCALKYIALFEPKFKDADPNLSECYLVLSDLLKGEAPKHMNPSDSYFLLENVQKLAKIMETVSTKREEEYIKSGFKFRERKCYSYKRKTTSDLTNSNQTTSNPTTSIPTTSNTISSNKGKESEIRNPLQIPDSLLVFS